MLSTSAFNALLKTIEEPPEYVIFIFATTELHEVPATIKSRCQQFNFRLVPIEKIKEQLELAAKEINIAADDEALYWIARESTGSMRDAYTLFDQVAAFSEDHITYEKIRDKLGLMGTDRLNELFEKCVDSDCAGAEEKLEEFLQSGVSIEQLITNSADYLRNLLLIKNGITKEALLGQAPSRFSQKVLEAWSSVQIERALSIFLALHRDSRYSISPRYEIDLAFSRLCWLKNYASPSEVKMAIDKARALLESAPGAQSPGFSSGAASYLDSAPDTNEDFAQEDERPAVSPLGKFLSTMPKIAQMQSNAAPVPEQAADNGTPSGIETPEPVQSISSAASPEEIKSHVVNAIKKRDEFTASLLNQTINWTKTDASINAECSSQFLKTQLEGKRDIINDTLSAVTGKKMYVAFSVKVQEEKAAQAVIPEQVNILCRVFKGSIV